MILAVFCLALSTPANGEVSIPESAEARDAMFAGMADPVLIRSGPARTVLRQSDGTYVLFRTEEQNGNDYYLFLHETGDDFPLVSPGAYVIRRSRSDGDFSQVKVFLQYHPGSFVRIAPAGRRSKMDVHLAGAQVYRDVPVPLPFSNVLRAPFERIKSATGAIVDWDMFDVETDIAAYRRVEAIVDSIRANLPGLPDTEDGAMDENGDLVFIETGEFQEGDIGLNCSGFAKWIADGFYAPVAGNLLPIEPLKTKHLDARGTRWSASLEDERDPYFGLDWTRNLAIAVNTGEVPRDLLNVTDVERYDVRHVPLSLYMEDVGYPIDELSAVLYWLAKVEPGNVYLGSVSTSFGTAPVLRQHRHVAAFFPYFDGQGRFHAVVFDRNVESSIESLSERFPREFVHLVRLDQPGDFAAPLIPRAR